MLGTAVEWGVIEQRACTIRLVRTAKGQAAFYDFDEFERVVTRRSGPTLVVLLGGEAGLRCGEMMALEWGCGDTAPRTSESSWSPRGGGGTEGQNAQTY